MAEEDFADLLSDGRVNAVAAWLLVGLFALSTVESLLTGDYLWAAFAATVGAVVLLPAIGTGNPRAMPPWEIVLLAGLLVVARSFATLEVTSDVATYLSIAALGLLIAVNLHIFTTVEMNIGFAVLFVVVTTLATAGLWAVARWGADVWLGTELLLDPALTESEVEHELMWEFVGSAVAGLLAGLLFEGYVHRRSSIEERLQEEAT